MASPKHSKYPTQQLSASDFVESCGAIPFMLSKRQIFLVRSIPTDEWVLAKGRRDCNESRRDAAVRELQEESGLRCRLLPVTMSTRAPGTHEPDNVVDEARIYPDITEPFMFTLRDFRKQPGLNSRGVKLIFWYIAAVDETNPYASQGEETYETAAFGYEEAVQRLTYELDRDILRCAIEIVERSYPSSHSGHASFL